MEHINGGHIALGFVGFLFLVLQVWWISLTLKNGRNERFDVNLNQTNEIKKRLEKLFYS